ncbi:response regulator transcription factor [Leadbettera azotonutricia]|uniref:Response regulator receiver n=1 Tax=Leadbettera azotonutricia (strain ATCC BAA-888 / DSM 13862 / ZAS-9) TaxID=545695 RepID=F5YFG5_LEAAZ|nr:response regulator [Leadbettera azotonutricia]AEF82720.1 response regulator receiver [Leadbettera azotonutricia ZAS-9]
MNTQKKILVVDDETINLDFFELMLSKLGFIVEKAKDGVEGLEKVKRFLPDLVLLDNIMPRMSGWELTKLIKGDPKYKEIPIIMLSALDDVKDKVEGFEMGVDDYITKPFNFSEVLARIKAVLRNRELFGQIVARESRLSLAEELSADIKHTLLEFVKSIDDLDAAIDKLGGNSQIVEKTQGVRRHIAELDARLEKTLVQWEDLKKNEIGLPLLEVQIRELPNQE